MRGRMFLADSRQIGNSTSLAILLWSITTVIGVLGHRPFTIARPGLPIRRVYRNPSYRRQGSRLERSLSPSGRNDEAKIGLNRTCYTLVTVHSDSPLRLQHIAHSFTAAPCFLGLIVLQTIPSTSEESLVDVNAVLLGDRTVKLNSLTDRYV